MVGLGEGAAIGRPSNGKLAAARRILQFGAHFGLRNGDFVIFHAVVSNGTNRQQRASIRERTYLFLCFRGGDGSGNLCLEQLLLLVQLLLHLPLLLQ